MDGEYKKAKESFVSDTTGSSIFHINLVSVIAWFSIALYHSLSSRLTPSKAQSLDSNLLIAWAILVIPLLLSMTLFALKPAMLSLLLLVPTGLLLLMPTQDDRIPLPPPSPMQRRRPQSERPNASPKLQPLAAVTVWRAHMMLMTILAILAVDFPVFPRELAKCETWGVSLMDLGVGSFVFSQGLVSAIPLIKDPGYLFAPALPKIVSVIRKCIPVILLGIVRVILVKGVEYPEHESEYGTHWNFFITLALLPVLQVCLHPILQRIPPGLLGVLVALAQQASLSLGGLRGFVLDAPRTSLISANKEGLVSLSGYLAVHLLGLSCGTLILPPTPKYFPRALAQYRQRVSSKKSDDTDGDSKEKRIKLDAVRQNDKTAIELFSYSFVWWTLLGFITFFGLGGEGISRRMVNLPYILWVAAFNTSFLFGYLLLDLLFDSTGSKTRYSQQSKLKLADKQSTNEASQPDALKRAPALLEAINKNSLLLFLLANVVTGLVNLTIPTMYTSDIAAMGVLSGYAFGICGLAWGLRWWKVVSL